LVAYLVIWQWTSDSAVNRSFKGAGSISR